MALEAFALDVPARGLRPAGRAPGVMLDEEDLASLGVIARTPVPDGGSRPVDSAELRAQLRGSSCGDRESSERGGGWGSRRARPAWSGTTSTRSSAAWPATDPTRVWSTWDGGPASSAAHPYVGSSARTPSTWASITETRVDWCRKVEAAGRCRVQYRGQWYECATPRVVPFMTVSDCFPQP